MDKQTEREILSTMFKSGVSEKIAPPPKWYRILVKLWYGWYFNWLFFISAIFFIVGSIWNIFVGRWISVLSGIILAIIYASIPVAIYTLGYFYRRNAVLKVIRNMPKQ